MGAMVPPSRKSCYNFRVVSIDRVVDGDLPPKPKPLIPRQELKGEIDIYEPTHWHQMQMMFQRNARRTRMEQNATLPSDAINNALDSFREQEHGSNGSTKSEELL